MAMPAPMRALALLLAGFGLGLGGAACRLPNPDHCFNISAEPNAWCAARDPARPYCAPCAAQEQGCVAVEPTLADCDLYTTPAPETGTGDTGDTSTDS